MSLKNNALVPSLTLDGWLKNENELIDRLFLYFRTTLKSQSTTYYNDMHSWLYLRRTYKDKEKLKSEVKKSLEDIYERYFIDVEVEVEDKDKDDKSYYLIVHLKLTNNENVTYSYTNTLGDEN